MMKIGFIGHGNMAKAIIAQIKQDVIVSDANTDNQAVVDVADIIFLTIKPQLYKTVLTNLKNTEGKIFVSVAPGLSIAWIQQWIGGASVVRTMPNTPAMVGAGVTAIVRDNSVAKVQLDYIKRVFEKFSTVFELDESTMDVAVALSGSSPVLGYTLMDAMAGFGAQNGLDYETAKRMAAYTLIGSAKMILETNKDCRTLINDVASPGGTTEQMLKKLNEHQFAKIIQESMEMCLERAKELRN